MFNNQKTIKKFTCCRCLEEHEVMSDKDSNPLYLCSGCRWIDRTRTDIIVELDGAPTGYVKGSPFKVKQKNSKDAFRK